MGFKNFYITEADSRARGHLFDKEEWSEITAKISKMSEGAANRKQIEAIKKVVNGKWIMDLRKIKGGPAVGKIILDTVEWIQNENINILDIDKIKEHILGVEI